MEINAQNIVSNYQLLEEIGKRLKLLSSEENVVIKKVASMSLVILIHHCTLLLKHDKDNFFEFLVNLIEQTKNLKVIFIPTNSDIEDEIIYNNEVLKSKMFSINV